MLERHQERPAGLPGVRELWFSPGTSCSFFFCVVLLLCASTDWLTHSSLSVPGGEKKAEIAKLIHISRARKSVTLQSSLLEEQPLDSNGVQLRPSWKTLEAKANREDLAGGTSEVIAQMADALRELHTDKYTVRKAVAAAEKGLIDPLEIINTAQSAATHEKKRIIKKQEAKRAAREAEKKEASTQQSEADSKAGPETGVFHWIRRGKQVYLQPFPAANGSSAVRWKRVHLPRLPHLHPVRMPKDPPARLPSRVNATVGGRVYHWDGKAMRVLRVTEAPDGPGGQGFVLPSAGGSWTLQDPAVIAQVRRHAAGARGGKGVELTAVAGCGWGVKVHEEASGGGQGGEGRREGAVEEGREGEGAAAGGEGQPPPAPLRPLPPLTPSPSGRDEGAGDSAGEGEGGGSGAGEAAAAGGAAARAG